jgi:hypothetical protein
VIRETATNVDSYALPEGHIQRANTGESSTHYDGESVRDAASKILKHPLPEWYSMNQIYKEFSMASNIDEKDLYSFDVLPDLDALAAAQGVRPVENIDDLVADFWPEDENVEDFIAAATEGRHEEEDEPES